MNDFLNDLRWRGLLHDTTDLAELSEHLKQPRRVYAGFDPSGDSLTIGNLVPLLLLRRFQLAGHTPVVVMGGGTGLVGDPSGKDAERQLLSSEQVAQNVQAQRPIFDNVLNFEGEHAAILVNNLDWLSRLGFLEVLRDTGKHFAVNMMIQKDSIKSRLEQRDQGISYTEFSYMILQAYDFLWLYQNRGVTLQVGGSDQWGNVVAGIDLVRRVERKTAFGLTHPLVTKSDGGKFGKTEAGAVWLTPKYTSAYAFFQFWLNTPDADVERYLKLFTFLSRPELEQLMARHQNDPGQREAQRALAEEVTRVVHGEVMYQEAQAASMALFSGEVSRLSEVLLSEVFGNVPSTSHLRTLLADPGLGVVELLLRAAVAKSKRAAREFLDAGAISINGKRVDQSFVLTEHHLLHDKMVLIRRGRKTWHVTRWS
jgi:tyrosyl-tRNA synthetase